MAMHATDLIRRLHQHRMWATHGLLDAVRPLSDEQLRQQFAIGQGSAWQTLTHLLAAEYVWLEALSGNEAALLPGDVAGQLPGNQAGTGAIRTLDELVIRWQEVDRRWNQYLASLTDESLDEIVYKISTSSGAGKRHGTRRADILLHVCTHAQYTTAQLLNMLRQLGVSPLPDVMLISLARQQAPESPGRIRDQG
jgi:uncharacterized damage-inducible protein DinB